ncbi:Protein Dr1-like [Glycine soja]|uniref:Protein Dr1-like n=1 Tax=Glycine soja TaxID=3848 RepID=A0A445KHU6_GLYSO|nr:Protein Dr1-like [Glycine soja]
MTKIIKEMLPPDVRVARDAQDLLIECCVELSIVVLHRCVAAMGPSIEAHPLPGVYSLAPSLSISDVFRHLPGVSGLALFSGTISDVMPIHFCCKFINLVSSESNEVCNREDKRTIAPEHVLKALQVLGFGEYVEEVYAAYEQHKLETMDSLRGGGKWSNGAEMTEEEALAEQQRMFAEARARMNGGAIASKQPDADQSLDS